jgi:alkylhydroperoxidase family enzyme
MRSGTRRTCGSTAASPSSCACEFRNSTLRLLPQPALRRGARGGYPLGQDPHRDRGVGDRALLRGEQAALRYTEGRTRVADTDRAAAFQRFHDALAEHFSPEEILEIVAVVVNMNVWTGSSVPRARCRARPEL